MAHVGFLDELDEGDSTFAMTGGNDIHFIENSNEWTQWRDEMETEMFTQWQLCN